jgi:hypothetical protein
MKILKKLLVILSLIIFTARYFIFILSVSGDNTILFIIFSFLGAFPVGIIAGHLFYKIDQSQ